MKIVTFQEFTGATIAFHGVDWNDAGNEVTISLTINDCLNNAAHLHMSPDEAEEMARILIVNAWCARYNKW